MRNGKAMVITLVLAMALSFLVVAQAVPPFPPPGSLNARVAALEAALTAAQADIVALESLTDNLVLGPAEQLATVRGVVKFDGTIVHGDGFTVANTEVGAYLVLYDAATFSDVPTVLVKQFGTLGFMANVDAETSTGFTVLVKDQDGNAVDISWRFIALGPR